MAREPRFRMLPDAEPHAAQLIPPALVDPDSTQESDAPTAGMRENVIGLTSLQWAVRFLNMDTAGKAIAAGFGVCRGRDHARYPNE